VKVARCLLLQDTTFCQHGVVSSRCRVAQTRISALDAPRRELAQILGDLEELYVARLQKEAAGEVKPGGSDQIEQARQHVLALLESQDQVIGSLKASLAS